MKAAALAAAAIMALRGVERAEAPLTGFSPPSAARQREIERRLVALPRPEECGAILREITSAPHVAGTEGNARVADFLASEYRKAGFDVRTPTYDVLLSYPRSAKLEIVGEPEVALGRREEPIAEDPDSDVPEAAAAWNAYSPSAEVVSEVVYVNRGSAEDYQRLAKLGIDVRGRIALARYFGGYRGGKSLEAEKRGVAAVIVYSDPIDDGWFKGPVYPGGPWGPASHFQRGANVYDFLIPGDPLTPGWASTPDARRIPASESQILPKIPMMPLSWRDAAEILKRLRGPAVPDDSWQGLALPETFRVGPGPVRLHLRIENSRERRPIKNVIATLRGNEEPDRIVLLSNHYDAWVYGAADPSSGTAALLTLGRALGRLAADGFRPRRTIVMAAWDAEEFTLTGSTEWGEENEKDLKTNAVVCINVDEAAHGRLFSPSASPLLFAAIRDAARDLPDPGAPGKSLADTWRESAGFIGVGSYATAAAGGEDLPVAILGSGSDYTVFFNHLGIASADLVFDGPYGVYHSVYDSYRWMATEGDPGFHYTAAMATYAGLLALRFANAEFLPFDAGAYGREIARYADDLAAAPASAPLAVELRDLAAKARAWSAAAEAAQKTLAARLQSGGLGFVATRDGERLASLARTGGPRRRGAAGTAVVPAPDLRAAALLQGRDAARHPRDPAGRSARRDTDRDRTARQEARRRDGGRPTNQRLARAPATSDTTA